MNIVLILIGFTMNSYIASASKFVKIEKSSVADSTQKKLVDLICKMKVKAANAKTVEFKKNTYYFCSESCRQKFVAEPKKYIKN